MTEQELSHNHHKGKKVLWIITICFVFAFVAFFLFWFFIWRFEERTNDAYVHGNQIVVTPQISGYISSVSVNDTEVVKEGRILVELDKIDRKLALENTKNILGETVRNVTQLFENVKMLKAEKHIRKAKLAYAAKEYQHRKKLVDIGGVSREDFQRSEADFIAAFAALLATQHQLRGAQALIEKTTIKTHPLVESAKDALREAYVNFQRCTIRSPSHGMVAMKKAQVGESISPESPLMMIAPLDQIWINANFKETQLHHVRIGQSVKMTSDIYGHDVVYYGKVVGISAGTGSVMSVLPPQNATGNWIKIVQRLPVRISLDPTEIEMHPLRLGLSMHVKVDTHNRSGKMIPSPPPPGPLYSTDIFQNQDEGVEMIIEKIIEKNMTFKEKGNGDGTKA